MPDIYYKIIWGEGVNGDIDKNKTGHKLISGEAE